MSVSRILILGGYGSTGRPLTQLLFQTTDAQLIIAGRNLASAQSLADTLNSGSGAARAAARHVDAADPASLRAALSDVDVLV
ncbi:MAG: saccharopine dehydrogenase NADP-binding domain-containing protein, partial [Chloroflexi bacterium]|nr:saccharopine dehydrogenase NADP-binding domain-containing protein [Chloroflexota bacterium]